MTVFDDSQHAFIQLREQIAERTTSVVAWVGSGLSAPAGIPTWRPLRKQLCEELLNRANQSEEKEKQSLRLAYQLALGEDNLWRSFQMLRDRLGPTTYRELVRRAFRAADTAKVPDAYRLLWSLRISGMISLNLDRFASRSYAEINGSKVINTLVGKRAASRIHILKSQHPFIATLHGTIDDYEEWVFTQDEMQDLLGNAGYTGFVNSCFMTKTVVFVGISADDIMAGGHLAKLSSMGLDCGCHYWITDRNDRETVDWAERCGVQVVHYRNQDGTHEQLTQALTLLNEFVPRDETPAPVSLTVSAVGLLDSSQGRMGSVPLPAPEEIEKMDAESIRTILNTEACRILSSADQIAYKNYFDFVEKYSEAIYRAWFVSKRPPKNRLLGYELIDEIAEGAFGSVYHARSPDGENVAIKVLHEKIRNSTEMLQGFRRGVAAMTILAAHKVKGVVTYKSASEIPAFVVMEKVEGPSLSVAVESKKLTSWGLLLRIALELVKVIHSSHQLAERVLHRDIRPSNVMLRNGWELEPDAWEVVVLDFDLSWHRDATEVSVSYPGSVNGYLAPEQVNRSAGVSTRNALVDSYGIGLTLYFLRTGKDPQFLQPQHGDWENSLQLAARTFVCQEWRSLPKRFFRLVFNAARCTQSQRWDVLQIKNELERLQVAAVSPTRVSSTEMIVEEIAARSFPGEYCWDCDALVASISLPTGVEVRLQANEVDRVISLEARWLQTGNSQYSRVQKWIPRAKDLIRSALRGAGWTVDGTTSNASSYEVGAWSDTDSVVGSLDLTVTAVEGVFSNLAFDR